MKKPGIFQAATRKLNILFAAWIAAVAVGVGALWLYAASPARLEVAPTIWPVSATSLEKISGRTLVMFLHPKCSCSRASVSELAEVTRRTSGQLKVLVIVVLPAGAPPSWGRDLAQRPVAEMHAVKVVVDVDAVIAKQFNARTSGETFVYGADGRLEFHGGITGARGHVGDNAGRRAIVQLVQAGQKPVPTVPVFGCSLLTEICGTQLAVHFR